MPLCSIRVKVSLASTSVSCRGESIRNIIIKNVNLFYYILLFEKEEQKIGKLSPYSTLIEINNSNFEISASQVIPGQIVKIANKLLKLAGM